jgi:hypothetical protein
MQIGRLGKQGAQMNEGTGEGPAGQSFVEAKNEPTGHSLPAGGEKKIETQGEANRNSRMACSTCPENSRTACSRIAETLYQNKSNI